ncbi:hypothetical protein OSTOST_10794 [Ostertagia ostertagi]
MGFTFLDVCSPPRDCFCDSDCTTAAHAIILVFCDLTREFWRHYRNKLARMKCERVVTKWCPPPNINQPNQANPQPNTNQQQQNSKAGQAGEFVGGLLSGLLLGATGLLPPPFGFPYGPPMPFPMGPGVFPYGAPDPFMPVGPFPYGGPGGPMFGGPGIPFAPMPGAMPFGGPPFMGR